MEEVVDQVPEQLTESLYGPVKEKWRFRIAKPLRIPLIWTLFFAIVGIIIQSSQANSFVFLQFFGSNFIDWLSSLGFFTNPSNYSSSQELIAQLASKWYYFFYTGGLLSLIWGLISWIINLGNKAN